MTADKKQIAESTVAALQQKWGSHAIHRLRSANLSGDAPHIPTGFSGLDEILAIGGFPRGRISEIAGVPTSGMATIALSTIANAQKSASPAVYIDPEQTFDPEYAVRCGIDLERLLLVRPFNMSQAITILGDFVQNLRSDGDELSILVFDTPANLLTENKGARLLATTLDRIAIPLSRSSCALIFLVLLPGNNGHAMASYPQSSTLPYHAAVRLFIQRQRWLYKQRDIHGYRAQVEIVKNKFGPQGQKADIAITFGKKSSANLVDGAVL